MIDSEVGKVTLNQTLTVRRLEESADPLDVLTVLGEMPSMAEDSAKFTYWLCAVLPLRMDEKYAFLQLDSSWQRYSTLYAALKRLEQRDSS